MKVYKVSSKQYALVDGSIGTQDVDRWFSTKRDAKNYAKGLIKNGWEPFIAEYAEDYKTWRQVLKVWVPIMMLVSYN